MPERLGSEGHIQVVRHLDMEFLFSHFFSPYRYIQTLPLVFYVELETPDCFYIAANRDQPCYQFDFVLSWIVVKQTGWNSGLQPSGRHDISYSLMAICHWAFARAEQSGQASMPPDLSSTNTFLPSRQISRSTSVTGRMIAPRLKQVWQIMEIVGAHQTVCGFVYGCHYSRLRHSLPLGIAVNCFRVMP